MCSDCNHWSRGCTSDDARAKAWAVSVGATGPIAPETYPRGPRCPGLSLVRRSSSRTTTPCYTEKL